MPAICLYFQIHRPYRLRRYTVFDLGQNSMYEDDDRNCDTLLFAARNCYLPMNDVLLRLIQRHGKQFRVSFSISGIALEQFEQYAPEVVDSFKALAKTGCVEFLAETYSHSMTFLYAPEEFERQVKLHSNKIMSLFGQKTQVYRHTELIYNNDIAKAIEKQGFMGILGEGSDHVLGWRSPNFVYQPIDCLKLKLLLRNFTLSTDISRRFTKQIWDQWPLTAEKFASWCHDLNGAGETLNLFMDYDVFGLRHTAATGIFEFMDALPAAILANADWSFRTPSQVIESCLPVGKIDVPQFMSWATSGQDLDRWLGNDMQKDAIHSLYALADRKPWEYNEDIQRSWLHLQSSDHFAYMCTKWFSEHAAERFDNPFGSPYDAYINYMNVLADFELTLDSAKPPKVRKKTAQQKDVAEKPQGAAKKSAPAAKAKVVAGSAAQPKGGKVQKKQADPRTKSPRVKKTTQDT